MSGPVAAGRHLIDVPTLAERLGVKEGHVRRLVQEQRIPFLKIGGRLRFDPSDIDGWLASNKVTPRP